MICLFCENEFEKNEKNFSPNVQKYCNSKCRSGYNAKKRYERLKNDKDFSDRKKSIFRNWYERNKEKHRESVLTQYYKKKGISVLIIGCGINGSGTEKLAKVLDGCNESSVTFENQFNIPKVFDLDKLKDKLKKMDLNKKYAGDVEMNYLNYAEYLINKVNNAKVICMFVESSKTVSNEEYKEYYSKAMELAKKYSHKFKIVDVKLLKTMEGLREIFSFCSISESDRNYKIQW